VRDWLDGLPDGLDTRVGERGEQLSAGERQLVALIRAGIADPDVLVLDEATSSVDALTEVRISRALTRLAEGRTTIAIAHRLSTAAVPTVCSCSKTVAWSRTAPTPIDRDEELVRGAVGGAGVGGARLHVERIQVRAAGIEERDRERQQRVLHPEVAGARRVVAERHPVGSAEVGDEHETARPAVVVVRQPQAQLAQRAVRLGDRRRHTIEPLGNDGRFGRIGARHRWLARRDGWRRGWTRGWNRCRSLR
jgi:hypothetical protein